MTWQQRRAEEIANRIDRGVIDLTRAAEDPAGVLNERGYDDTNAEEWGAAKKAAADAARTYANQLRERVAAGQPVTDVQLREAEKVADAANLGGLLIDSRPLAESQRYWEDEQRHTAMAYENEKRDAITGSGAFQHVAEEGQVPYWQLRRVDQTHDCAEA